MQHRVGGESAVAIHVSQQPVRLLPVPWLYEVDLLQCPRCGGAMRLVAFILERATIVRILSHLGEATDPPRLAAICDPPEAARAAFAPELELQAFDAPADVLPDDEDQRQDDVW